jgi:hypothetical protein
MMTRTASRASRILIGLATLLLVVSIAVGLVILLGATFGFSLGNEISVHTPVDGRNLRGLPPDALIPADVDVTVVVHDPTDEQARWFALRDLPEGIIVVAMLWLVRGLLRSVRDGDPFNDSNVRRLRALALFVLIGVPLAAFVKSIIAGALAASAGLPSPSVEISVPGAAILGGLALLVLSEVFAEGVHMRDDLEGTV